MRTTGQGVFAAKAALGRRGGRGRFPYPISIHSMRRIDFNTLPHSVTGSEKQHRIPERQARANPVRLRFTRVDGKE